MWIKSLSKSVQNMTQLLVRKLVENGSHNTEIFHIETHLLKFLCFNFCVWFYILVGSHTQTRALQSIQYTPLLSITHAVFVTVFVSFSVKLREKKF